MTIWSRFRLPRRRSSNQKFLVRIVGRRLRVLRDGSPLVWGFATTRFQEAPNAVDAGKAALLTVLQQCVELQEPGSKPPDLRVLEIADLGPDYRGLEPREGFTFFDDEDDETT